MRFTRGTDVGTDAEGEPKAEEDWIRNTPSAGRELLSSIKNLLSRRRRGERKIGETGGSQWPDSPGPRRSALATLKNLLGQIPWEKLRPRLPKLKKLFGPFLVFLIICLLVGEGIILRALSPVTSGKRITVSQLFDASSKGLVKKATFLEVDSVILVRIASQLPAPAPAPPQDSKSATASPPPPAFVEGPAHSAWLSEPGSGAMTSIIADKLIESGAQVSWNGQADKKVLRFIAQFLIPLMLLATVFSFFFLIITGHGSQAADFLGFSRYMARVQRRRKGKGLVTFKDVAAIDEGIVELQEVVDYLTDPTRFVELGARAPKGLLLVGPPGTGKTLLARAVAGEANVPFIQLSGSEFVESLVGVGAARVRDLFRQARELAPCIIFIDELDAAGRQRGAGVGGGNDEREQTLNQLLVEMDGFSPSLGLAVLGATNRPDILDPALLRPGRFDRQVVIDVPDVKGRLEILGVHARGRPLDSSCELMSIAKQTPGFTGADLANIVNEAALLAVRSRRSQISHDDFEEAVDRTLAGPERKSHILTEEEKLLIAYHEAGHAVVARGAGQETGVLKLSIVARGLQLGHASTFTSADRLVQIRSELEGQITTLLGGMAAEKLLFGEVSTSNAKDLEKATTLTRKIVATWGMTDKVGGMQVLHEGQVFMGRDFAAIAHTSSAVLNLVDSEIRRILDECERRAIEICRVNRPVLDEIVQHLLERETMLGPELEPFLEKVRIMQPSRPLSQALAGNGGRSAPAKRHKKQRPADLAEMEPDQT